MGDGPDVLLDAERAVLLDGIDVCLVNASSRSVDNLQRGPQVDDVRLALQLDGRVNKTRDRAKVLYIMDVDGAAAIISELLALATRVGPEFADLLMERLNNLQAEGHLNDGA